MIEVPKDQLKRVEYLIEQSARGNHVLFDPSRVRKVLKGGPAPIDVDAAYAVEHHIERVIEYPTLEAQRAYLDTLEPIVYDQVVQTYFNIVENMIYENAAIRH